MFVKENPYRKKKFCPTKLKSSPKFQNHSHSRDISVGNLKFWSFWKSYGLQRVKVYIIKLLILPEIVFGIARNYYFSLVIDKRFIVALQHIFWTFIFKLVKLTITKLSVYFSTRYISQLMAIPEIIIYTKFCCLSVWHTLEDFAYQNKFRIQGWNC